MRRKIAAIILVYIALVIAFPVYADIPRIMEIERAEGFELFKAFSLPNEASYLLAGAYGRGDSAKAALLCVDSAGNLKWRYDAHDPDIGFFRNIYLHENGEIVALQNPYHGQEYLFHTVRDGVLIEKEKRQIDERATSYAVFSAEDGYIETFSIREGTLTISKHLYSGAEAWTSVHDGIMYATDILPADEGYYIIGTSREDLNKPSWGVVLKLSEQGQPEWYQRSSNNTQFTCAYAVQGNGLFAAGDYRLDEGNAGYYGDSFSVLFENGTVKNTYSYPYIPYRNGTTHSLRQARNAYQLLRSHNKERGTIEIIDLSTEGEMIKAEQISTLPILRTLKAWYAPDFAHPFIFVNGYDAENTLRTLILRPE
jgi:hypothetical protein